MELLLSFGKITEFFFTILEPLPLIFKTLNLLKSNSQNLKYQSQFLCVFSYIFFGKFTYTLAILPSLLQSYLFFCQSYLFFWKSYLFFGNLTFPSAILPFLWKSYLFFDNLIFPLAILPFLWQSYLSFGNYNNIWPYSAGVTFDSKFINKLSLGLEQYSVRV